MLLEMRTDGELTKDEYIEQKSIINDKINALEKELDDKATNNYNEFIIDYDKILSSLNEFITISTNCISAIRCYEDIILNF